LWKINPYCGKLYEFHKISTWKPAETVESKNGQKTGVFHRQQRQNAGTGAVCRVAEMPSCSGTLGQPAELLL